MKYKKGFTLIEILIAISLLSILTLISMGFVFATQRVNNTLSGKIDENVNVRIALEFLSREISNSNEVFLIEEIDGTINEIEEVNVISVRDNPLTYLKIGEKKIYIINEIIRYDTKSQQVVSGIKAFSVKHGGQGVYFIGVYSENYYLSTCVYKGK